ncbi:MAG: DJ-1/PfpI family protein [Clostridiales bacterium]|nr:DJ-1/PfpI family protein [Clostridiales bacterium]
MRKLAVMIYENFSMFEFGVALEMLTMVEGYSIDVFGEEKQTYRSEEGLLAFAEHALVDMDVSQYEGLIFTGFLGEAPAIYHNELLFEKIREFHREKKLLAAISIGPIFLIKAGVLSGLTYMCGCIKDDLKEEGFTDQQLEGMTDWTAANEQYSLKFIRHGHIVTSVIYGFREWAMQIGDILGIETYPKSFGLVD